MTNNKKILSTLLITLALSACGSSSTDNEAENATDKAAKELVKQEQESSPEQAATKLVATPTLTGDKMTEVKQSLKDDFSDWQRGRVQFLNLEGGFYGIITDSGQKILPMNMAKEFAQNGAVVRIKGKVKNVMTIQQWGTPFTITDIELISPGNKVKEADM